MRVLVLFAHPAQRKSSINLSMAAEARHLPGVTFVDLYADYPHFDIDVECEQARLLAHDVVIFQFPIFWYSTPALLKEWQDLVLEYGFAYGPAGKMLEGKLLLVCATTGGRDTDYRANGSNRHPVRQFLLPLEQTATLCGMKYLPPFVLHSANHVEKPAAQAHIAAYPLLLSALAKGDFDVELAMEREVITQPALATLIGE